MSFNVGDLVECIDDSTNNALTKGDCYTVDTTMHNGLTLILKEHPGYLCHSHLFRLIRSNSAKVQSQPPVRYNVGDCVVCIQGDTGSNLILGKIYTIEDINNVVDTIKLEEIPNYFFNSVRFQLAYPATSGQLVKRPGFSATLNSYDNPLLYHYNDNKSTETKLQCECGTDKVYGENSAAELHSDWCPKARKI